MKAYHPVFLALTYLRGNKGLFAAAACWRALWELLPMQVPILVGAIVDVLTGESATFFGFASPDSSAADVVLLGVVGLVVLALGRGLAAYGFTVASARFGKRFVANLRKRVARHLTVLSIAQRDRYGTADLLDRTLRDTQRMRTFADRVFVRVPSNIVRAAYPIVVLFLLDAGLAALALSVLPVQWIVSNHLGKKIHHASRKSLSSRSALTATLKETIDGMETVHMVHAEPAMTESLDERVDDIERHELKVNRLTAGLRGTTWLATSTGVAVAWWVGANRVLAGETTVGSVVVFIGLLQFAYRPFRQFTNIARTYRQGLASLERVHQLLGTAPGHAGGRSALHVTDGRIAVAGATVCYGDEPVLQDVTTTMPAKGLTVIAGASGCGKTTLLRLLIRLIEPNEGDVRIDDQELRSVSSDSLHAQIAAVPQNPTLFSASVYHNITLGSVDASREDVLAACRLANADTFVSMLDEGLETRVGFAGVPLPRAEVQRISLARALLKRPRVLLLDEPTSYLDEPSQLELIETLLRVRRDITVVMATNRLPEVRRADHVIALDGGRVIAEGTHEELLSGSLRYRELFPALVLADA